MNPTAATPAVHLRKVDDYGDTCVRAVGEVLDALGPASVPPRGARVLVKPNLVSAANYFLSTTHPDVVAGACAWLLDHGCRVTVGDSPGFGSAQSVGRKSGLVDRINPMGVELVDLGRPVRTTLPCGVSVGISAHVLEADAICNLPKCKAHTQFGLTLAVKNLFGCVAGFRKAVQHACHGDEPDTAVLHHDGYDMLSRVVLEVAEHVVHTVPHSMHLLDGVVAMHGTGPVGGRAHALGLLAASPSLHALDHALYTLLNADPAMTPLLRSTQTHGAYVLAGDDPRVVDFAGFEKPVRLTPMTFHPLRLVKGRLKSLWQRMRG